MDRARKQRIGLAAGNYDVTVSDANGCSTIDNVSVAALRGGPSLTSSSTDALCNQANGTATANATGGTAPYTFVWSDGQMMQTALGLAAGTYDVTVTDANGL